MIRHHVFSVFEKTGDIDSSLAVIHAYSLPKILTRTFTAGLNAELLVYSKEGSRLKLEPLLDAGVKADFTGIRKGSPVNIDVTTNLEYKDVNTYADVIRRKKKSYEIALVDLRKEEIQFFPLRFPICQDCGRFSHYILYMARPPRSVFFLASEYQVIYEHCPHCWSFRQVEYNDSYFVHSILYSLQERTGDQFQPETADPDFDADQFLIKESISTVKFFEKLTGKMLSGIAEEEYVITDPRDADGYWTARILWKHPLAKDIDDEYSELE